MIPILRLTTLLMVVPAAAFALQATPRPARPVEPPRVQVPRAEKPLPADRLWRDD